MIRRADSPRVVPSWYLKGSFVLDVVLGTTHARDVDLFYMGDRPEESEITDWFERNHLPSPPMNSDLVRFVNGAEVPCPKPVFDIHPVGNLSAPDGGGEPVFNMDCWWIPMSGKVEVYDYDAGASSLAPAALPQLSFLRPRTTTRAEVALKGLLKMVLYPPLNSSPLTDQLLRQARTDLSTRLCGQQATTALDALDRALREGISDIPTLRRVVKSAENELREC